MLKQIYLSLLVICINCFMAQAQEIIASEKIGSKPKSLFPVENP